MRIAVVGAGSWGTTLAALAAEGVIDPVTDRTTLWAREAPVVDAINERHINPMFLPDVVLSDQVHAAGGRVVALSLKDRAAVMLGYDRAQMATKTIFDLHFAQDLERSATRIAAAMKVACAVNTAAA